MPSGRGLKLLNLRPLLLFPASAVQKLAGDAALRRGIAVAHLCAIKLLNCLCGSLGILQLHVADAAARTTHEVDGIDLPE
jgi:hypothetical protein